MFYHVQAENESGFASAEFSRQAVTKRKCEKCGATFYDTDQNELYKVHFLGRKLPDFYQAPGCYIGNEKFQNMLVKYGLTGYELRDIECTGWYDRRENPIDIDPDGLKEIFILGKCGGMHHADGTEVEHCEKCGEVAFKTRMQIRGLSVPVQTWDGSDIFSFSNWGGNMIATDRVREACEKEGIRGIRFTEIGRTTLNPLLRL